MSEDQITLETVDDEEAIVVVQQTMDTFLGAANVDAVYGKPIESNGATIIPSAEILSVAGFGVGSGYGTNEEEEGQEKQVGGGGGGGGGGRVFSRPVAVVIVEESGVRVEPVVDPTKIALAFFTMLGFMVSMITRMKRNK